MLTSPSRTKKIFPMYCMNGVVMICCVRCNEIYNYCLMARLREWECENDILGVECFNEIFGNNLFVICLWLKFDLQQSLTGDQ